MRAVNNKPQPGLAVNMFRMRPGVDPQRFARFSAHVDQPTVLAHRSVISRFEAYRVLGGTEESPLGVDIIEIMEVSNWSNWIEIRDHDPSLIPVAAGFDELVELDSVRSSFVVPIRKGIQT